MSLVDLVNTAQYFSSQNNLRKSILNVQNNLRGTPQFAALFYKLIGQDVHHPPVQIEGTQSGVFWTAAWDPARFTYEPFTTEKMSDPNISYIEGCALFLLIQEVYPNVYKFPGNTLEQIQNGAHIHLNMRKECIGQAVMPAYIPDPSNGLPAQGQALQARAVVDPAPAPTPAAEEPAPKRKPFNFCPYCGKKITPGARFCMNCGESLQ